MFGDTSSDKASPCHLPLKGKAFGKSVKSGDMSGGFDTLQLPPLA